MFFQLSIESIKYLQDKGLKKPFCFCVIKPYFELPSIVL